MKKVTIFIILIVSGLLVSNVLAIQPNLFEFFGSKTLGDDPGQPDTLYLACAETGTIQVRYKTDNADAPDSILGFYIPLIITADKPGAVLDTVLANTYGGTPLAEWDALVVNVMDDGISPAGDPSHFPMYLLVGGHDAFDADRHPLGPGDHLIANLRFATVEPTVICIDTTSQLGVRNPLEVVTHYAIGYLPQWRASCCELGTPIPTLSQWGLIVFGTVLLVSLGLYLRRQRRLVSVQN
jgi:hypothetical protein